MGTAGSFDNYPETMNSEEVAELLGHPVPVILVWVREGKLPAHKEPGSRRWWFDRDEVIAWVRQHQGRTGNLRATGSGGPSGIKTNQATASQLRYKSGCPQAVWGESL